MNRLPIAVSVSLLLLAAATRAQSTASPDGDIEFFGAAATADRAPPFSDAVRVGGMLYVSGKIGFVTGQGLVAGGIEAETRQALQNVKDAVERYGSSMDRVVKCTVYLADMTESKQMNDVYSSFFPSHPPARSMVGVNGLAAGARVEIECMAALAVATEP